MTRMDPYRTLNGSGLLHRAKATSRVLVQPATMACKRGGKVMKRRSKAGGKTVKEAARKAAAVHAIPAKGCDR